MMYEERSGYKQVMEFHSVFCHPVENEERVDIFPDNSVLTNFNLDLLDEKNPEDQQAIKNIKLINFRLSLLDEEIKEYIRDGIEKKNYIEAVDALADTLYVLYGMCLVMGINFDKEIVLCPLYSNAIIKRTTFGHNNFDFDSYENKTNIENELYWLTSAFEQLKTLCQQNLYCEANRFNLVKGQICFLYHMVIRQSCAIKLCPVLLQQCFDEVHRSNMTKTCLSEEEAQLTVAWYKENEKRYEDPAYKQSVDEKYWIVYDAKTSKSLKALRYEEPYFNDILKLAIDESLEKQSDAECAQ
jgi:predicted HAD superfamily Cof-like phosphohydrolase